MVWNQIVGIPIHPLYKHGSGEITLNNGTLVKTGGNQILLLKM